MHPPLNQCLLEMSPIIFTYCTSTPPPPPHLIAVASTNITYSLTSNFTTYLNHSRIAYYSHLLHSIITTLYYFHIAVWDNINKGLADKLQKMENRAARILTFSNYEVSSSVLLDELGWERLEYVRLKQLAVTMYKIHNNLSPSYLRQIFTNTSNVHSHSLRNSELNC